MRTPDPVKLVNHAIAKGELAKLLLGSPEYCYRSRFSPAPGATDLTDLLPILYDQCYSIYGDKLRSDFLVAIYSIVDTYDGIDPVATCILIESSLKADGRQTLDLPLQDIACRLCDSIAKYQLRLQMDKTERGFGWPDGRLGDCRRLSKIVRELGGPPFCA